ncbi:hypothetical protein [Photobacterium leiognathi]|uniref:hypothetical protein n=1 Tax=Photobacterium leiognathi TaxID=553611 RepID=UPI002735310A|nr:hypothetical protein [Photobacterium leiognathi]
MSFIYHTHKFRNALAYLIEFESYKLLDCNGWACLNSFPSGSCGVVSDLLGTYLKEKGFSGVKIIRANTQSEIFPGINSHAWVEVNGKYVDITGHQFPQVSNSRISIQDKHPSGWLYRYAQEAKGDFAYDEGEPSIDIYTELYQLVAQRAESM